MTVGIRSDEIRDEVDSVSELIARQHGCLLEVACLDGASAGALVIVLIGIGRNRGIGLVRARSVAVEAEILGAEAFAQFFVGVNRDQGLAPSLNHEVWTVVSVEAESGVVEVVAHQE